MLLFVNHWLIFIILIINLLTIKKYDIEFINRLEEVTI